MIVWKLILIIIRRTSHYRYHLRDGTSHRLDCPNTSSHLLARPYSPYYWEVTTFLTFAVVTWTNSYGFHLSGMFNDYSHRSILYLRLAHFNLFSDQQYQGFSLKELENACFYCDDPSQLIEGWAFMQHLVTVETWSDSNRKSLTIIWLTYCQQMATLHHSIHTLSSSMDLFSSQPQLPVFSTTELLVLPPRHSNTLLHHIQALVSIQRV